MSYTKAQMIASIIAEMGFTKRKSIRVVEAFFETIKHSLESGDDVLISGFGRFCVRRKNERKGRNPATGEAMTLRPRKVVTFHCSRQLKDRING